MKSLKSIKIDANVHADTKLIATALGTRLSELVNRLLKEYNAANLEKALRNRESVILYGKE